MKLFLAISALVAVALADSGTKFEASYYPSEPRPVSTDPSIRVVNGQNAQREQFPYQISLQRRAIFSYSHICGGSIIAPKWILTAAHCVSGGTPSNYQIVAGILQLNDANIPGQQTVGVSSIIVHVLYPGGGQVAPNDIALLGLANNLNYAANVQPVNLPRPGYQAHGDVDLSGWGLTRSGGSIPNILQWVSLPIVAEPECRAILDSLLGYQNPFDESLNVCSGIRFGGESACNGDSGGPLVQNNVLIGAVSWGLVPCGAAGAPSVYVKVSAYIPWITENTNGEVRV